MLFKDFMRNRGAKNLIFLVAINIVLLAFIVLFVELFFKYYVGQNIKQHYKELSLKEFIVSKPLAFYDADDYDEIKREWLGNTDCPDNRIINDPVTNFPRFEIENVSCDGPVTMVNGLRTTVAKKAMAQGNYKNKLMFFGGSTMWGTGSADRNTIPSLVQALSEKENINFDVQNYGFASVVIAQQVRLLKTIPVSANDIVIFYDGGNDVWNSVVYGNPKGSIIGYNESNFYQIIINKIKYFFSRNSYTYQALGHIKSGTSNDVLSGCLSLKDEVLEDRIRKGFDVYRQSILVAKKYVEDSGGIFMHFLQPSLVSSLPLSDYVNDLILNMPKETKCGLKAFKKGYDSYRKKYNLIKSNINGVDLTQSLNSIRSGREYFWDYIHVSSAGNKVVANQMFDKIILESPIGGARLQTTD